MIFQKKKKKLILIGEIDQDNNCKDILVNLTLPPLKCCDLPQRVLG